MRNELTREKTIECMATLKEKGCKRKDVAEELGVSRVTATNWAKGHTCGPATLEKLAEEWSK